MVISVVAGSPEPLSCKRPSTAKFLSRTGQRRPAGGTILATLSEHLWPPGLWSPAPWSLKARQPRGPHPALRGARASIQRQGSDSGAGRLPPLWCLRPTPPYPLGALNVPPGAPEWLRPLSGCLGLWPGSQGLGTEPHVRLPAERASRLLPSPLLLPVCILFLSNK